MTPVFKVSKLRLKTMDLRSQQEKRSGSGGGWTVLQLVRLGETKGQSGAGLEEGSRRLVREAETATLELRCHEAEVKN